MRGNAGAIETHRDIFLTTPYSLLWARAHNNEKGRVERKIRFIRDSFFAAREFTDVDDLNAQARAWCEGQAADLRWPEDTRVSVREAFELERASLLALPQSDYPVHERLEVQVAKTPYVRFDLNDYSVPHQYVRRTLTVVATPQRVRILDGQTELAIHARSYDSAQQVEVATHIQALEAHKRASRQHRATDALAQAAPAATELLKRAAARGYNLGSITAALSKLLERYGAQALQAAVIEALAHDVPHPNAVRLALERAREARHENPPVLAQLSERARKLDVTVRPHALNSYDDLAPGKDAPDDPRTPDDEDTT